MEKDPTKTMLRRDLVDLMMKVTGDTKAIMQAFVGDMIKRELLRYVGS